MSEGITVREFLASTGVEDWRVVGDGACAFYRVDSLAAAVRLVGAIAGLEGIDGHPPDIDIRADGVTVRLLTTSSDWYGVTGFDLEVGRRIQVEARRLGYVADPSALQSLLVVPGASDIAEILPFWEAVLGYQPRPDSPEEDLVDPRGRGIPFWFETMHEPRPGGGGAVHIAVWVPFEQAEARVAAALAAGGRLVRDDYAPAWWTLADPAGNEADISTPKGRD